MNMIATLGFRFARPLWLLTACLALPAVWLAWRNLAPLGTGRRIAATVLRAAVMVLLAGLLAWPELTRRHELVTVIAVIDRSQSVPRKPVDLQAAAVNYLTAAVANIPPGYQLAFVDIGEKGMIARLPSADPEVPQRNISLLGDQSALADGVQLALAIAPPDTAVRILLLSDGNETVGDLAEVARVAAANGIPIDVRPIQYRHEREVIFRRLIAPARARSGQPVKLRFVLSCTVPTTGRLLLNLNGQPVNLNPATADVSEPIELRERTTVKTITLPRCGPGIHEFVAHFMPDNPDDDRLSENNKATATTFVAGKGHVLVVDADGKSGLPMANALKRAAVDVRHIRAGQFPTNLTRMLDADAVIMVNTENSLFSFAQQDMLCRYVTDLGGGLIMVGGPDAFGAGGWIGSPVAEILPVNLDPKQKKVMPKGALVLIMHACEMPQGNLWNKRTAIAAVNALSRRDLVGVLEYQWNAANKNWVYPLSPVGDRSKVIAAIQRMQLGDMPDFGPSVQAAYNALKNAQAAQKHIIIISDGDPQMPSRKLLTNLRDAGITCTGVAVFPHSPQDVNSLRTIAAITGGRFYDIRDPNKLPQIFIKEAQVVRRVLRVEETFVPRLNANAEVLKGIRGQLPALDGYILTEPRGGLSQVALTSKAGDPVMATWQTGLGRVMVFTSSADSRWASAWLGWEGFGKFWKQATLWAWAGKRAQGADCEVYADVQGRDVTVSVEALSRSGEFIQLGDITGHAIGPDMAKKPLTVTQVGPGQYRAGFRSDRSGSYLVTLHYRKAEGGEPQVIQSVVTVPYAPEYEDLTDNSALLAEVAQVTGGRILPVDPTQADLFSHAGLKFPQTPLPLNKPLMLIWVVLFLLDVAVRRVALDVGAAVRRASVLVAKLLRRRTTADETLEALKARRKQVRQQLDARGRKAAATRYVPKEGDASSLPAADVSAPPEEPPRPAEPEPEAPPRKDERKQASHLDRLLRAKRQARNRMDGDQDE